MTIPKTMTTACSCPRADRTMPELAAYRNLSRRLAASQHLSVTVRANTSGRAASCARSSRPLFATPRQHRAGIDRKWPSCLRQPLPIRAKFPKQAGRIDQQ